jgi:acetyl-CoA carboxylase carboxyltransferase component
LTLFARDGQIIVVRPTKHEAMDPDAQRWEPELEELRERQRIARRMGGPKRIRRQHDAGKLTVRERIGRLIDPDSFLELGSNGGKATYDPSWKIMTDFMPANGVFCRAMIDGGPVVVFGDDFTVRGGSADPRAKLAEIEERLQQMRSPFRSAEAFLIEEIIDPRDTRPLLREFANMAAPLRIPGQSFFTMRP